MVALPLASENRLQRVRTSVHRLGTALLHAGYLTTTATGLLVLFAAVLYMRGITPTVFSNPTLSGLIFASATVSLLLETSGKALAPRELNWAESFVLQFRSRRKRTPGKHLAPEA